MKQLTLFILCVTVFYFIGAIGTGVISYYKVDSVPGMNKQERIIINSIGWPFALPFLIMK